MSALAKLFGSSIGQKAVMAVTGLVLALFVLGHMAGNLQAFLPSVPGEPHALDTYGVFLRELLHGGGLWIARLGLLAATALHVWAFVSLTRRNQAARPEGYRVAAYQESTFASRSMRLTGPLLALFIVYHLLHMTTGTVHPSFEEGAVYRNLVSGLSVAWVAVFYLVAMACLAFHLFHGAWSLLQTLGASHPRWDASRRRFAAAFTAVVVAGFAVVPLAVLLGLLK